MRRFYFRLARELGAGSVSRLLRIMPSSEIAEWIAVFRMEAREEKEAMLKAKAISKVQGMKNAHRR